MFNKRNVIVLLLAVSLVSAIQVIAQVNSTPEVIGVVPSINDNEGWISIAYRNQSYETTVESVKLVIGDRGKNKHVFAIELFTGKNEIRTRIDDGEWKSASLADDVFANEFFSINLQAISHTWKKMYGWIILPISFDAEAILGKPGSEAFEIFASVKDIDGNKTDLKKESAFQVKYIAEGLQNTAHRDTLYGSNYKWVGWRGDDAWIALDLSDTVEQKLPYKITDDEQTLFYVYKDQISGCQGIYENVSIADIYVLYWEENGVYKHHLRINYVLTGKVTLENLFGPMIHVYKYYHINPTVHMYCLINRFFIPTWWLPVLSFGTEYLEN